MTSPSNALLPMIAPKRVIGRTRPPNRSDLRTRDNLQGLPDPDTEVVLRRAALRVGQAALGLQQTIIEMQNGPSLMRDTLTVLADPEAPSDDSDWETVTNVSYNTEDEERDMEDEFIAKVKGVPLEEVARVKPVVHDDANTPLVYEVPAAVRRLRTLRKRGPNGPAAARRAAAARAAAAPSLSAASAPAPSLPNFQPGTTRQLTITEATLALTNAQSGTDVTMSDLRFVTEIEDNADTYPWTVGSVSTASPSSPPILHPRTTRQLTITEATLALTNAQSGTDVTMSDLQSVTDEVEDNNADTYPWTVGSVSTAELTTVEAALILTNMRAGTNVTMEDLRTARLMVDLWDCGDTFRWTVGNVV